MWDAKARHDFQGKDTHCKMTIKKYSIAHEMGVLCGIFVVLNEKSNGIQCGWILVAAINKKGTVSTHGKIHSWKVLQEVA